MYKSMIIAFLGSPNLLSVLYRLQAKTVAYSWKVASGTVNAADTIKI